VIIITTITRDECYKALFKLKIERGIDIDKPLQELASSNRVPKSVIKFNEEHNTRTLDDFLNTISRNKPFFQNLCDYEMNPQKHAKALLSMITHILITIEKNPSLRDELIKLFRIKELFQYLTDFTCVGDAKSAEMIEKITVEIRKIYLTELE
jgi:hypothetical protein